MFALVSAVLFSVALRARASSNASYPYSYANCGVSNTVSAAPTKVVTMNQGATEFLLAMGLEGSMVGTAYLDDSIWPKYATAYASIPVLSSSYPDEDTIMDTNPDFIVASYSSAFRALYTTSSGSVRGVFNMSCTGNGSEYDADWTTCRPQLNAMGIGTYVFEDACEDSSLRPANVTEETVYEELQTLGAIFGVDVQPIIDDMKEDFDNAAALVSSSMSSDPLKTVWLDCVGRCCTVDEGEEEEVFVGAGDGAPNMLMREAGLTNVFSETAGNWACVKVSSIIDAAPDVIVVVDAAWDTAAEKIQWLYNDVEFCKLDVLKAARFVSIPFSATTLSPRNGPAAYDLAIAAIHVRTGAVTSALESGVTSFNPYFIQAESECGICPMSISDVVYTEASDDDTVTVACITPAPTPSPYPVAYTNCGVSNTVSAAPTKVITMNQGATEFLLAMGLEGSMVGTAYLDDAIWPKYATAYASIPVLSSSYPDEDTIMDKDPDFIVASYNSAFRALYTRSDGSVRGIFNMSCTGPGSDYGEIYTGCRPQLNEMGIGTYIFEDHCENTSLRPDTVTEETIYEELRTLGSIFGVDAEPIIDDMKEDFDSAAALVSSSMDSDPLKTVWLDCVGRCCDAEDEVFVGGGTGAPNLLMVEAGLTNVFSDESGGWVCVKISAIVAADPDVIVVVDAAWDSAAEKIQWLYNDEDFCQLDVLKAARFVSIPFSATTLSPRNGPAAYDLAIAAIHVRTGAVTPAQESGVTSFNPYFIQAESECGKCPMSISDVVYTEASDDDTVTVECPDEETASKGARAGTAALYASLAASAVALSQVSCA